MKKILYIVMLSFILVTLTGCNNSSKESSTNTPVENKVSEDSKSLVLYFSATGTTRGVASKLASASNSDLIEIIPKEEYTSADLSYGNDDCRANQEQNNENARPEISNNLNLEQYEIIYLGYPIWWGDVPKIILTLLDSYDLDGKTVIPFCTSGSSSITQSQNTLESYKKYINWLKGKRFSSSVTESELTDWINTLSL